MPTPLALLVSPHCSGDRLRCLADALAIPLIEDPRAATLLLQFAPDGLSLIKPNDPLLPGRLRVDFSAPDFRRRLLHPGQELLVQAAKVRGCSRPLVIDATAGLGRDGFLLAAAGCRVRMIELHPVIAALLADGLSRARNTPALATAAGRIELVVGDAREQMLKLPEPPEVIFLDPMFPERTKSALVGQELRLLQLLAPKGCDPESLLPAALAVSTRKVVVKRPLKATPLAALAPSYTRRGKAVRFDVYLG
ncbi:MAG: class I SAM-dependent methyltransferase, partial [Proteobacteria bacterium]|nr:class I SAM-dependent methyltransferase [Pseudomonadota bacterium]